MRLHDESFGEVVQGIKMGSGVAQVDDEPMALDRAAVTLKAE
jgi:hypothetical protein